MPSDSSRNRRQAGGAGAAGTGVLVGRADEATVLAITEHLCAALEVFAAAGNCRAVDLFMAAHNFHEAIVLYLDELLGMRDDPALRQAAIDTFSRALTDKGN